MKTIVISLQKGGVGKTSLSVSLAAELAKLSGLVLLIDADPQGNSTAWIGSDEVSLELADVLTEKAELQKVIMKTSFAGLSLLPTAGLGGDLKSFGESGAKDDPMCMRRLIKDTAKLGFHCVVIDLSPAWGAIERSAALAADQIITPILGDSFAADGLQIFSENLETLKKRFDITKPAYTHIIVNAIDGRIKQHIEMLDAIKASNKNFSVYSVPVDPAFRMAQRKHVFIQDIATSKTETRAALSAIAADIWEA
ncbi:MAG: sporulation initiation inhibitor protein Soj [Candidatus Endomicrobiellum trichonymphae]|uniref:ParA family protein n=1 Tax=Endomicrobium trichonymphae TaxID=1408204 RepID=UPI0027D42EC2|nr:MAG: sporulation initiation inhibitor protein Soj [Candidatus Endomicrobium trichonymphae]